MVFVIVCILLSSVSCQVLYSRDPMSLRNASWMSNLDDGVPLRKLSLLGTYNSMATQFWDDSFQTQQQTLDIQLLSGIRALDIQCRHQNNKFQILERYSLGIAMIKKQMNYVLNLISTFLSANNREVVIMRVTETYSNGNSQNFETTFKFYRDQFPGLIWIVTTQNPSLGNVRGKIVIIQNFISTEIHGLMESSFSVHPHTLYSTNWDQYDKWVAVKAFISSTNTKGTSSISFWTGSKGSFPYFVASGQSFTNTNSARLATGLTTPGFKSYYPDFPRVACFIGICTIAFEGINILGYQYIQNNNMNYLGIIYCNFYGETLLSSFIGKNILAFKKCSTLLLNSGCTFCSSNGNCLGCNETLHYVYNTVTLSCDAAVGYYLSNTSIPIMCSSVMPGCQQCSSGSICLKCDTFAHYKLQSQVCIAQPGYYLDGSSIPTKCNIIGCAECSSAIVCTACSIINNFIMDATGNCVCNATNYFTLVSTSCLCITGRYLSSNNTCQTYPLCPNTGCGCLNCTSPPVCDLCDSANHFIPNSSICVCDVPYYFDGTQCVLCNATLTNCDECASSLVCLSCLDNFTLTEGICSCMPQYYQFDSDTCLSCPLGCLICSGDNSCTKCNSTAEFFLISGICECPKGKFPQNGVCKLCSAVAGCVSCTMAGCTECDTTFNFLLTPNGSVCSCISNHFINTMNMCEKCPMQGCLQCINELICTACDTSIFFLNSSSYCDDICGDGIRIYQECDDGNLIDGDGCSSVCKIEKYFNCLPGGRNAASACSFSQQIQISVISYVKAENKNEFTLKLSLTPYIPIVGTLPFSDIINISFPTTFQLQLNKQTGEIVISFQYNQSLTKNLQLSFDPPNNPQFLYTNSFSTQLQPTPTNNLALLFYQPSTYSLINPSRILTLALIIATLTLFLFGFFVVSKLMAIEFIVVFQLAYLPLSLIDRLQALTVPLIQLQYSNGYSIIGGTIVNLPYRLSAIGYKQQFIANFNIDIALLILPLIIGLCLYIFSKITNKQNQNQKNQNKQINQENNQDFTTLNIQNNQENINQLSCFLMKEWGLSTLLFVSYQSFLAIGIQLFYATSKGMGIAIGASIFLQIIVMILLFLIRPHHFGQYKTFFKEGKLNQNYYVIIIIIRIIIGIFLILPINPLFSLFSLLACLIIQLLLNIILRPYLANARPILNNCFCILIIASYSVFRLKILQNAQFVTTYLPLGIIGILFLCILTNLIFFILYLIKKYRKQDKEDKNDDSKSVKQMLKQLRKQMDKQINIQMKQIHSLMSQTPVSKHSSLIKNLKNQQMYNIGLDLEESEYQYSDHQDNDQL